MGAVEAGLRAAPRVDWGTCPAASDGGKEVISIRARTASAAGRKIFVGRNLLLRSRVGTETEPPINVRLTAGPALALP